MFGGAAGGVNPQTTAKLMRFGYDQIQDKPNKIKREYTDKIKI